MGQRIVKLIGIAYSTNANVHVKMNYNDVEVFNSTVNTNIVDVVPSDPPITNQDIGGWSGQELIIFETTTETTGEIPVSIIVTGGTLFFGHFWMNYTGYTQVREATDPNVPIDPNNPSTFVWVTTVQPDSYYADPNTNTEARG